MFKEETCTFACWLTFWELSRSVTRCHSPPEFQSGHSFLSHSWRRKKSQYRDENILAATSGLGAAAMSRGPCCRTEVLWSCSLVSS
ncbi:hypothetical protein TcWFU_009969 [Taenia crassiceps]|uniref:Secreted protein n=1 Tax=Taenia crassiceps TaxID=6207 RepID=A0ABR4QUB3_9CEST